MSSKSVRITPTWYRRSQCRILLSRPAREQRIGVAELRESTSELKNCKPEQLSCEDPLEPPSPRIANRSRPTSRVLQLSCRAQGQRALGLRAQNGRFVDRRVEERATAGCRASTDNKRT